MQPLRRHFANIFPKVGNLAYWGFNNAIGNLCAPCATLAFNDAYPTLRRLADIVIFH